MLFSGDGVRGLVGEFAPDEAEYGAEERAKPYGKGGVVESLGILVGEDGGVFMKISK